MSGIVRSPVRPAIREASAVVQAGNLVTLMTQATSTPTPSAANRIRIDEEHDAVAVWIGELPADLFYVNLYVHDGSTTHRVKLFHYGRAIINASPGRTLSFGATERRVNAWEGAGLSLAIAASPFKRPTALTAPSGATGSANVDQAGPPVWSPSTAHVLLPAQDSEFQIDAAAGIREIFLSERDASGTWSPIRHLHVPSNTALRVRNIHREIALASYAGVPIAITAPAGTIIGGSSNAYHPGFSLAGTSRTVSETSDGFGGDQGSAGQNLAYALKNVSSGDEIVLASGTYSISAGGDQLNPTNYGLSAFNRTLRIRSSTGNAADVTVDGSSWYVALNQGIRWVVEGITFDFSNLAPQSGASALFEIRGGTVDLHRCNVVGPSSSASAPNFGAVAAAFWSMHTASFCTFQNTAEDNVDVSGSALVKVRLVGCTIDGNDSPAQDQLVTCHNGSTLECWGCTLTAASQPGSVSRIAADVVTSPLWLLYCRAPAAGIANADGIVVSIIAGAYFCDFPKCAVFLGDCLVGNTVQEVKSAVTRDFFRFANATSFALAAGNTFTAQNSSGSHGFDIRANVESFGNRVTCTSTNGVPLRCDSGSPPAGSELRSTNDRFTAFTPSNNLQLGTSANVSLNLRNAIFDGSTAYSLGASGAACSARNCFFQRSSAPTNWSARFLTDVANTFSASAPVLESDGAPTIGGNCDDEGSDPSQRGGLDHLGRLLWLGASFVRGPLELATIKNGQILFPDPR